MVSQKKDGYSVKISFEAKTMLDEAFKLTGCSRIRIIEKAIKNYCSEVIEILKASENSKKRAEMLNFLKEE